MALPIKNGKITTAYHAKGHQWSTGYHTGVDFAVPSGTNVLAACNGVVLQASWGTAYGEQIVVALADKTFVIYAHLSKVLVQPGNKIKKGQHIAESGNSGNSSGAHLHFERRNAVKWSAGVELDPTPILAM